MNWNFIIGKTIKEVDTKQGDNIVVLRFTDGTIACVDTQGIGFGLYTPSLTNLEDYPGVKI